MELRNKALTRGHRKSYICNWYIRNNANTIQDALLVNTSKEDESKTAERLAFRLKFLQDKKAWFEWHKSFLKICHDEKVIPNGLRITLELSIGNSDDEFNTKWYERLNDFF